jgi:hypothetical protein
VEGAADQRPSLVAGNMRQRMPRRPTYLRRQDCSNIEGLERHQSGSRKSRGLSGIKAWKSIGATRVKLKQTLIGPVNLTTPRSKSCIKCSAGNGNSVQRK